MAILSVTETWAGETSSNQSDLTRTYARTFQVISDNALETVPAVGNAPGIPMLWDRHPDDIPCYCNKVDVKRVANSRTVWSVTASYTNKVDEDDEPEEDPLARPWKLSWSSAAFQIVAERGIKRETIDALGNTVEAAPAGDIEGPIVNSAGDQFDPPIQIDSSNWTITAKKNVATVPTWLMDYRDALNDATITIAGVEFDEHELRISAMSIGEFTIENDVGYYPFQVTITQKKETWTREILDQGTHEIKTVNIAGTATDSRVRIVDKKGQHVTEPIRLDGSGQKLEPDTAPIEDSVFIKYQVYLKDRDFSALSLPTS